MHMKRTRRETKPYLQIKETLKKLESRIQSYEEDINLAQPEVSRILSDIVVTGAERKS